jgi:muramidase (phage lysozyme)
MFEHGVGIRNPLFFIGVVENNVDPRREQRVQVRAFGVHGTNRDIPTDELPWALCVKGDYDPNGSPGLGLPAINSWVFGVFLDGRDCQQPMILGLVPTQNTSPPNPSADGYGVIPPENGDLLARGSEPESYGQPQNSRLARGENIEETAVLEQEATRVTGIRVGGTEGETWDEPGPAYAAQYPFNRVIESGAHTIELDDTPGAERIMITHRSGSYVQIDARGTFTEKAVSDKYEITDRRQNVYVGGSSTVTIMGNSHVYVRGNKTEEIEGDYQQIVHGNHMLSVGGQMNLNASEQVQMRAADIKIQANVGTLSIHAAKELQTEAGIGWYGKAPRFWMESSANMNIRANNINLFGITDVNIRANSNMNIHAVGEMNIKAEDLFITGTSDANLSGATLQLEADGKLSIMAATVAIDDVISMANADADFSTVAGDAVTAEPSISAGQPEMPEPAAKSTSVVPPETGGAMGSTGISSRDSRGEEAFSSGGAGGGGSSSTPTTGPVSAVLQTAVTPLLDLIGNIESDGYDDISGLVSRSRYPSKPLTQMTIQEVLDWQESIDPFQLSEASGRYQIMEDTLRGYDNGDSRNPRAAPSNYTPLYTAAGLSASDLFSPINQDKMAVQLLRQAGLERYLNGSLSQREFANRVAGIWAALPLVDGDGRGQSAYQGDSAGNASRTSVQTYLRVLDQIKSSYENTAPPGDPTTTGPS